MQQQKPRPVRVVRVRDRELQPPVGLQQPCEATPRAWTIPSATRHIRHLRTRTNYQHSGIHGTHAYTRIETRTSGLIQYPVLTVALGKVSDMNMFVYALCAYMVVVILI